MLIIPIGIRGENVLHHVMVELEQETGDVSTEIQETLGVMEKKWK